MSESLGLELEVFFRRGRGGSSFYSGRGVSSIISGHSEVPRSEVTYRYDDEYETQSAFTELSIHGSNTITGPVQANQDERNQDSF